MQELYCGIFLLGKSLQQIFHFYFKCFNEIMTVIRAETLKMLNIANWPLFFLQDIHKDLERKLAKFHEREDAILYSSCYDANAGLFEVLLNADDAVISDELNHASIIDGIRLCKAQKYRFKHRNLTGRLSSLRSVEAFLFASYM